MSRALAAVAVAALTLAVAACSSDTPPTPTLTPTPTPIAATEPAPARSQPMAVGTPAPSATPTPVAVSEPTPTPFVPPPAPARVAPPDRDLHELALRLRSGVDAATPRAATTAPPARQVGYSDTFWITDMVDDYPVSYEIRASVVEVSEHAYWYVDDKARISVEGLRQAAEEFETRIHPLVTGATGDIWNPGVDGDPRLTVLHTPLTFAAGYFGSSDEFTKATHPKSNEREMIYMNTSLEPGGPVYLSVLAHEFQHAVAWNQDGGEESWINEGLAEYATEQAGYGNSFARDFLSRPGTQLNFWPDVGRATVPHYGAAELFVHYLADHFGGYDGVGRLFRLPQDGVDGVDAYLAEYGLRFEDVFGDWVVANYLDLDDGLHGYPSRSVRTPSASRISGYGERTGTLAQFGTRYFELALPDGDAVIRFQGAATVGQTAADCYSGGRCWWSNRGDSINPKLTREFDLSGLDAATLEFWAWYDIEEGWDYAYVEASGDGGLTWRVLAGEHSTTTDPVGNAYGPGYTGESGGWVRESVDLTPFAGGPTLVRFEYVTDDAVHKDGLLIDDIGIPELGYADDAESVGAWQADGFALIDNVLPQSYIVQVIEIPSDGGPPLVRRLTLDANQGGEAVVGGIGSRVERAVVAVSPTARHTHQRAEWRLSVEAAR